MYIESVFFSNADGSKRGPYFRRVSYEDGVRSRQYLAQDEAEEMVSLRNLVRALRRSPAIAIRSKRGRGRPPAVSPEMRSVYEAAGYRLRGDRVIERRDVRDDPRALAVRFALLSPDLQRLFGSWQSYADVLHSARRRLKSANRRRVRGYDFAQAMADELEERYHG